MLSSLSQLFKLFKRIKISKILVRLIEKYIVFIPIHHPFNLENVKMLKCKMLKYKNKN